MKKTCFRSKKYQFWRLDSVLGFWAISGLLSSILRVFEKNIALPP